MEDLWRINGGFMEDLWRIYGGFMEDLWKFYEGFMEDLWRVHGGFMEDLGNSFVNTKVPTKFTLCIRFQLGNSFGNMWEY